MSGCPIHEQTRAAVVQLSGVPAVVGLSCGVQLPPDGADTAALTIEPALPQVLPVTSVHVPVPDVVADSVTVRHAEVHAPSTWNVPVAEHICPEAVQEQVQLTALPVGPACRSVAW